jgi:agmatine deiminase
MRDSGPIVVKNSAIGRRALQFGFNGWAKYPNHLKDRKIPAAIANTLNIPLTQVKHTGKPVVLEGGAIDHNGAGTLITTEECLLHPTRQVRNPGFTKADYEAVFAEYFGTKQVIWLGDGIDGDDTHGHVDDICRFVNDHTVIACVEPNTKDPNHKKLRTNLERLQNITLVNGKKLEVIPMPMPGRIDFEDMRLPASYVNFIYTNGGILVPTFNDVNDYKALGIFNDLFPDRKVLE